MNAVRNFWKGISGKLPSLQSTKSLLAAAAFLVAVNVTNITNVLGQNPPSNPTSDKITGITKKVTNANKAKQDIKTHSTISSITPNMLLNLEKSMKKNNIEWGVLFLATWDDKVWSEELRVTLKINANAIAEKKWLYILVEVIENDKAYPESPGPSFYCQVIRDWKLQEDATKEYTEKLRDKTKWEVKKWNWQAVVKWVQQLILDISSKFGSTNIELKDSQTTNWQNTTETQDNNNGSNSNTNTADDDKNSTNAVSTNNESPEEFPTWALGAIIALVLTTGWLWLAAYNKNRSLNQKAEDILKAIESLRKKKGKALDTIARIHDFVDYLPGSSITNDASDFTWDWFEEFDKMKTVSDVKTKLLEYWSPLAKYFVTTESEKYKVTRKFDDTFAAYESNYQQIVPLTTVINAVDGMQKIQEKGTLLDVNTLKNRLEAIHETNTLRFDSSLHNPDTFAEQKTNLLQLTKNNLKDINDNSEEIGITQKLAPQHLQEVQVSDNKLTTTINTLDNLEKTIKKSEKSYQKRFVNTTSEDSFEFKLIAVNRSSETYPQLLTISTNSNLVNLEKNAKSLKNEAMELYKDEQKNRSDINSKWESSIENLDTLLTAYRKFEEAYKSCINFVHTIRWLQWTIDSYKEQKHLEALPDKLKHENEVSSKKSQINFAIESGKKTLNHIEQKVNFGSLADSMDSYIKAYSDYNNTYLEFVDVKREYKVAFNNYEKNAQQLGEDISAGLSNGDTIENHDNSDYNKQLEKLKQSYSSLNQEIEEQQKKFKHLADLTSSLESKIRHYEWLRDIAGKTSLNISTTTQWSYSQRVADLDERISTVNGKISNLERQIDAIEAKEREEREAIARQEEIKKNAAEIEANLKKEWAHWDGPQNIVAR